MSVTHRQRRMLEHVGESYLSVRQIAEAHDASYGSTYATACALVAKDYLRAVPREGVTHYTITPKGSRLLREPVDASA